MPAQSEAQRAAAGMALRYKRGQLTKSKAGPTVKKMAKMSEASLRDFARKSKHHAKPMRYHKTKV